MSSNEYRRFSNLSYDDFRELAKYSSLNPYEKIGFPNSYREGGKISIFEDINRKLPTLLNETKIILDIGPGCSELPSMLIEHCEKLSHTLFLADSEEMLELIPDRKFIKKFPGIYPHSISDFDQLKRE